MTIFLNRNMFRRYLSTSQIARAVGVHPNTVRMYETWGLLPPIARSPNGYRRFTPFHLDQMRLARTALHGAYPGRAIRRSALALIHQTAQGDLGGGLESAYHHLALVQSEQAQAEGAVRLLERWASGAQADSTQEHLHIGAAAQHLSVTTDMLRNWERSGLLRVPRDPHTGYRLYSTDELSRLRVIRMLSRAGYSMMAILRMLLVLDQGQKADLRQVLDTPRSDEDVYSAADRWLTALTEQESRALELIAILEEMIAHREAALQTGDLYFPTPPVGG
jgi:DNA-binding transcriptional MerR regulator